MSTTWTWSQKRQAYLLLLFSGVVFVSAMVFFTIVFFTKPEVESKYGGQDPIVMWSKVFPVEDNLYGIIVHFNNTEPAWWSPDAGYRMVFFNEKGEPYSEHRGRIFFEAGESFFVFDTGVVLNDGVPAWTGFYWEDIEWREVKEGERDDVYKLSLSDVGMESDRLSSRLQVVVENTGALEIPKLEAVALVVDEHDNVLAASRSVVGPISFGGKKMITLSWPMSFNLSDKVACIEPLEVKLLLLGGSSENEEEAKRALIDFNEEVESGFFWSLDSISIEDDGEVAVNRIKNEIEDLRGNDNSILIVIHPDDINEELRGFWEGLVFVRMLPMRYVNSEYVDINREVIKRILDRNCAQESKDVKIYTRVIY